VFSEKFALAVKLFNVIVVGPTPLLFTKLNVTFVAVLLVFTN